MIRLVCLLEEASADEMLKILLPKILPENIHIENSIVFEGKQDLEKQIIKKLKFWNKPNTVFMVLRDQDSENCVSVKERLKQKVQESGKSKFTMIRIACRELESFYLGDLKAVENGLKIKGIKSLQHKVKYRNPDNLNNAKEELRKLTHNNYEQKRGSKAIASYMAIDGSNKSESFNMLISGIKNLISNVAS